MRRHSGFLSSEIFVVTGLEDGSAVGIKWKTPEKETFYTVRSEMTFQQLNAYFLNFKKKSQSERQ